MRSRAHVDLPERQARDEPGFNGGRGTGPVQAAQLVGDGPVGVGEGQPQPVAQADLSRCSTDAPGSRAYGQVDELRGIGESAGGGAMRLAGRCERGTGSV